MRVDEAHELDADDENAWCSCGFELPQATDDRLLVWSRHLGACWLQWAVDDLGLEGETRDEVAELARYLDMTAWSGIDATPR